MKAFGSEITESDVSSNKTIADRRLTASNCQWALMEAFGRKHLISGEALTNLPCLTPQPLNHPL